MDQRKQREIASKGGQAAHQKGTAHEFTTDEARAAGRKGGETVSANRAHMSAIGRKGGESSHGGQKAARQNTATPESSTVEQQVAAPIGHESSENGKTNGTSSNGDDRDHQPHPRHNESPSE